MRLPLTLALLCTSLGALGQAAGTYQSAGGQPVSWTIDSNHNLVWGGQPYLPVGLEINGDSSAIQQAKKLGFHDVIVDVPPDGASWKTTIASLETSGMRYLLSIDGLFPSARGFSVEPEAYRIDHITSDRDVKFPLPGATSALAVLVTQRDAAVQNSERVPVMDGKFNYHVVTKTDQDEVLLVYPEQSEADHPDYWDGFDGRRDALLTQLAQCKLGPGLRGILNPLGKMFPSAIGGGLFVPESPYFRSDLITFLRAKYRSVDTVSRAWGLGTNDLDSFDALARLVPLWSGTRGVRQIWDTGTNNLYECDDKHSAFWEDINTVVAEAAAKRFERLILAVQSVACVPVLQDWTGWSAPFEATTGILSGVGFTADGQSNQDMIVAASRPTSSVVRWKSPGWILCTHLSLNDDADGASSFRDLLDQMESMGVRGWFLRDPVAGVLSEASADANRRETDTASSSVPVDPLFFPENALNPAFPKRLPGGKWWLPSPQDGNRLDLGAGYLGYVAADGPAYSTVLWTDGPAKLAQIHAGNPKGIALTRIDGTPVAAKMGKKGVIEVTVDSVPLVMVTAGEVPVPEECLDETVNRYAQLVTLADEDHVEIGEYTLFLKDTIERFDRDPGGALTELRKKFWQLNRIVAPFDWIEAESSRDTNFSQMSAQSGCSGGAALSLHTPVTTDPKGFYANYNVHSNVKSDLQVWIAGKIPKEATKYVTVEIAGQRVGIQEGPVSPYGNGFGWYHLGTAKLLNTSSVITLSVNSPEGAYLAVDVVLLYPGDFKPNGVNMPPATNFAAKLYKKKKGRS